MEPYELTLSEAAGAIKLGQLSPVELVDSTLDRLQLVEPRLGAYVQVTAERARLAAREAEAAINAKGARSPLHGIPVSVKDVIDVAGLATTAGSLVRADHQALGNSAVAGRLANAGAVLVGKTQTHEFAYGLITPQTRNAWDQERIAGGSSGGSAVAVAAGSAMFALGTDTGGSIRVPAALNGVVGLKPTYGLVPRHGVVPLSWSLDHVGPLTRTVEDAALVLTEIAGHDPRDPASRADAQPQDYRPSPKDELTGVKVGVPSNYFNEQIATDVDSAVVQALTRLNELGAELIDVEIPMPRYVMPTQWGLMVPEATAYHERTLRAEPNLYQSDVRPLLEAGALVSAGDYLRAQRGRALMRSAWAEVLQKVDVVIAPSVPMTAVRVNEEAVTWANGTFEAVSDAFVRMSAPANITGFPSLSVPIGQDLAGMPTSMQLIGAPFTEALLLQIGHTYELTQSCKGVAPVV
ncbi:amidase [Brevibacterium aurantiacum]|uniref:Asp-tRNA(Asn)/Glu-tRNA(Gln) amidotransferase GatCAB subunit A n=1 Tax=Brevibacterium aurantiacum TaxID=273384 RepID=A0A2A3Z2U6_BREAU|nr:amidase [Brevibacterium aurantiacum]PCC45847.1 Asp-tRNA(Asn)/Glu-tRNA(Gln) amidotransferase GatCAB subunit A [Brevibacterium aurantiacum]